MRQAHCVPALLPYPPSPCKRTVPPFCDSTPPASRSSTKTACWSSAPMRRGRQRVQDAGAFAAVAARHPGVAVTHWPGRILAPGFVDMHIHFPQTDIIGAPADGPAALARELHLPGRKPLCRPGPCGRGGRGVPRRAAAQRRHHRADLRDLASGVGRRLLRGGAAPAAAHDHRQGAAGPPFARRRARPDRAEPDRHRGADPPLAQRRPPGLRDHAALRAHQHRRATARRGRTGGEATPTPGSIRTWPRTRTR